MPLDKPLSKEELEALINIASQAPDPKEVQKDLNSVEQWIYAKDIKAGKHIIKPYELYHEYKKWASKPLNFQIFTRTFKRLFAPHRVATPNGSQAVYFVDPSSFDLSLDSHFQMLKEMRKARERRKKKKDEQKKATGNTEGSQS